MNSGDHGDPGRDYRVVVGRIGGVHGVRGWLRVSSFTDPPENLLDFGVWLVGEGHGARNFEIADSRVAGKGFTVHLAGVDNREQAGELVGRPVSVMRSSLPPLPEGRYYWCDLIGMVVRGVEGEVLGKVKEVIATGANDVLVVEDGSRMLIPFLPGRVVREVSIEHRLIRVDWQSGFAQ